jgi:hypothetical protein
MPLPPGTSGLRQNSGSLVKIVMQLFLIRPK